MLYYTIGTYIGNCFLTISCMYKSTYRGYAYSKDLDLREICWFSRSKSKFEEDTYLKLIITWEYFYLVIFITTTKVISRSVMGTIWPVSLPLTMTDSTHAVSWPCCAKGCNSRIILNTCCNCFQLNSCYRGQRAFSMNLCWLVSA